MKKSFMTSSLFLSSAALSIALFLSPISHAADCLECQAKQHPSIKLDSIQQMNESISPCYAKGGTLEKFPEIIDIKTHKKMTSKDILQYYNIQWCISKNPHPANVEVKKQTFCNIPKDTYKNEKFWRLSVCDNKLECSLKGIIGESDQPILIRRLETKKQLNKNGKNSQPFCYQLIDKKSKVEIANGGAYNSDKKPEAPKTSDAEKVKTDNAFEEACKGLAIKQGDDTSNPLLIDGKETLETAASDAQYEWCRTLDPSEDPKNSTLEKCGFNDKYYKIADCTVGRCDGFENNFPNPTGQGYQVAVSASSKTLKKQCPQTKDFAMTAANDGANAQVPTIENPQLQNILAPMAPLRQMQLLQDPGPLPPIYAPGVF